MLKEIDLVLLCLEMFFNGSLRFKLKNIYGEFGLFYFYILI